MNTIKPFSYKFYYFQVVIISLCGFLNSLYLSIVHYKNYTDIEYSSFCAISRAVNCDTVSQSKYSIFLGLPVSLWGGVGFLFLFYLVIGAGLKKAEKKRGWALILLVSSVFSLYSLILAFISGYYIKSYCILCIFSYAVNLLMMFYSWFIHKRFEELRLFESLVADFKFFISYKCSWGVFVFLTSLVVGLWCFLPRYWLLAPIPLSLSNLNAGVTELGHPWIGAKNPTLTITEFSDYRCFQCKKIHFFLRKLVSEHSDKLRLIHRHYPMDHSFNPIVVPLPFHEGSGKLALIGVFASIRGDFWRVNDALFNLDRLKTDYSLSDLSNILGLSRQELWTALNNKAVLTILNYDIQEGMKHNIMATPALVINGKVYIGSIPPEEIKKAIDE